MKMIRSIGLVLFILVAGCTAQKPVAEEVNNETALPGDKEANPKAEMVSMTIGAAQLVVEVRDTEEERELGLSYRESIDENEGMVFVFDQPAPYSFWMLGMEFPLDMIWVRDGKVVDISKSVPAPESSFAEQPETRTPNVPIDMVVEVNEGWVERHGVKVGDEVSLSTQE